MELNGINGRTCPGCGADVPRESKYCTGCGSEVPVGRARLKKAFLFGVAASVLLLALIFSGSLPTMGGGGGDAPEAPDFTSRDVLSGEEHSLSDYRGEWVFVDFSTSWCSVCQRMAPILEQYYLESKPDDVVFLTISNEGNDVESFREFARENDAGWPHLIDPTSSVYMDYDVQGLPTFVLVDPEGKIRAKSVGYMSNREVERFVEDAKSEGSGLPFGL